MIYFVQAVDDGEIKIGTTIRLSKRLGTLASEFGVRFKVLGVMPGGRAAEAAIHRRFSHVWRNREFFAPDDELKAFIVSEAKPWDGKDEAPEDNKVKSKIDAGVITKAKFVADMQGISLAEYLTSLVKGPVDRDFAKAVRQASEDKGKA